MADRFFSLQTLIVTRCSRHRSSLDGYIIFVAGNRPDCYEPIFSLRWSLNSPCPSNQSLCNRSSAAHSVSRCAGCVGHTDRRTVPIASGSKGNAALELHGEDPRLFPYAAAKATLINNRREFGHLCHKSSPTAVNGWL